jgi:hypothetical protein
MEGLIRAEDDPLRTYYNILIYDRELTKKEVEDYELDRLYRKER